MKRIIEEDIEAPGRTLRIFAGTILPTTLLIRFFTRRAGFIEGECLCGLVPLLVVYCQYHVGHEHQGLRRSFRINLSLLIALAVAILMSQGGLRDRSLDIFNGLVFGLIGGIASHMIGLITSAAADPILDRIRQFIEPQMCRMCGYDLTGNTSGTCPECGTSISLHLRHHAE